MNAQCSPGATFRPQRSMISPYSYVLFVFLYLINPKLIVVVVLVAYIQSLLASLKSATSYPESSNLIIKTFPEMLVFHPSDNLLAHSSF